MNRFFALAFTILLFCISTFSQTKSIADAQNEIKSFADPQNFSVVYDSSKYVTRAEVKFETVEKKTPLAKHFKEFGFKITSLFGNDAIDTKPVRTTFCINTRSKKFFFSSDRNLTLTLDNEAVNLGEADRSTEVKRGKVRENLCWEIDKELVKDLGNASTIGYELGRVKGVLDTAKVQFFTDYSKILSVKAETN